MPQVTEQQVEFIVHETWAAAMNTAAWAARDAASKLPVTVSGRDALIAFANTCETLNRQDAQERGEGSA